VAESKLENGPKLENAEKGKGNGEKGKERK
jgi:hypothetical protein